MSEEMPPPRAPEFVPPTHRQQARALMDVTLKLFRSGNPMLARRMDNILRYAIATADEEGDYKIMVENQYRTAVNEAGDNEAVLNNLEKFKKLIDKIRDPRLEKDSPSKE